jgi:chromosomal replication initiation ATPase DnaA
MMTVIETPRSQAMKIIKDVAEVHGVTVRDIFEKSREKKKVLARHEAIRRVAAAWPKSSTTHLGAFFNRDHTTILYALGRTTRNVIRSEAAE